MTRFLLDTHALLWSLYEPARLSDAARAAIENVKNVRLVSAVTAWEIATKLRLGKLEVARSLVESYQDHIVNFQATELAISSRHSLLAGSFTQPHRDPFDRLLAAQALLEGVPLITADSALIQFPIPILW
ncbi:type II toxin-antitoxin system VapC family toxin [bacterium]|nr:type II toxin-antitoxin system VapC family toxin [bacterium]